MLTNDELNLYKALYTLIGNEKNHKVLELEEIVQNVKEIDDSFDVEKIHDMISEFKNKDLIDLKYFTPDAFCLLTKKDLNELITETNVLRRAAEMTSEQPSTKTIKHKEKIKDILRVNIDTEEVKSENATTKKDKNYFFPALLGGLIGSVITGTIFIVLFFVLKR